MIKCVYLLADESKTTQKMLREQGFEVLVGDGNFNEELLARCGVLVMPGNRAVNKEILEKAPNLKFLCRSGVGMDKIDIPACTQRGVCVASPATANSIAVAEHTVALILVVAKEIYRLSIYLRRENPDWSCKFRYRSVELSGKTLAIIGLGNIGRRVAKIANAFDMKIIGLDPYANHAMIPEYIELVNTMEEALPRADIVTIHVAGGDSTKNMIGAKEFALMKSSAIFVNTTRGLVVDEKALYDALHNKTIAGAGLDVFVDEPWKPGNPLLSLDNLVATPHCAYNTPESKLRAEIQCAEMILEYSAGKRPRFAINNTPIG
jgi:D-3-phosphoglycerate dehydrogenase